MKNHYALAAALITGTMSAAQTAPSQADVYIGIQVRVAPPPLPVYVQPPLPGPDYIWTPGYWAWDNYAYDYYWVPGTWVLAPRPGYLWTPGYWGWSNGLYVFHPGYWGPHIGYYGGVAYGFGYTGIGFEGGYWNGSHYFYNRSVNNVTNVNVTNVYNKTVIVNNTTVNHISYNGGPGGVTAQPTAQQQAAERESHLAATPMQAQHLQAAHSNPALFAAANRGAPPVAATLRPAELSGPGVIKAEPVRVERPESLTAHQVASPSRPGAPGKPLAAGPKPMTTPAQTALAPTSPQVAPPRVQPPHPPAPRPAPPRPHPQPRPGSRREPNR